MEDVMLRMPTSDVALVMQFANRMGWMIDKRRNAVSRFIETCCQNAPSISDDEIQAEVNAVRYNA